MQSLHIPDHIRFECSGCGNCCLQWPVPATAEDVARIERLTGTFVTVTASGFDAELKALLGKADSLGLRPLKSGDQKFRGFTHTLEKRDDGRCQYLLENNRCRLHEDHGEEAKPAMCRLFPHAFSFTPSGIYAYVSFASSGVLTNHGRLLREQNELLEERLQLYEQLFPGVRPDWSLLQILDGSPLSWDQFLTIERRMLEIFETGSKGENGTRGRAASLHSPPFGAVPTLNGLMECSRIVQAALPPGADADKMPPLEVPAARVDRIILKFLHATYLPDDVFAHEEFDIDARALITEMAQPAAQPLFGTTAFDRLEEIELGELDEAIEDLLHRFVYARLFAKLYLGPNFAHLSLLAGIHHLFFVVCLVRLRIKQLVLEGNQVGFAEAAEIVRTIERRLSQMNFSAQSSAVMEVLFSSPSRLERLTRLIR